MGLWFEQLEKLQCHLLRPGRLGKSRSVEGNTKISDLTMTAVRCQSETKVDVLSEQSDVLSRVYVRNSRSDWDYSVNLESKMRKC